MAMLGEIDLRELGAQLVGQRRDVQFTFVEKLTDPKELPSLQDAAYFSKMVRVPRTERSTTFSPSSNEQPPTKQMPEVTKELLDARLEAIEARMDARVSGMSAKLDGTLAEIRADRVRFTQIESDIRDVKSGMVAISANVDAKLAATANHTDTQIRGLKSNIWFGVATTIAAVGATMAIAIASFDSGRETSKSISETTARMEKISAQLEAAAKAQAAKEESKPKDPAPQGK